MLGTGFNQNKCKTQCQLCCGRIRLMRNKRNIQLKNSRKEVANLLRTGKAENARIRVETVMREEAMLQAYDVVELFVELLQVRVAIVDRSKELPPDMTEAVSSLIYAAARVTDLQELGAIKSLLAAKFGKEYAAEAASDHLCRKWHVNDNLIRWLSIEAPTPEDKIACLTEIAQEHGIDWAPDGAAGPPGAKAYLSGDRTSYSDPLTPPSGGWGGNSGGGAASYGGSHAGGGARVTSIYDSEGPFGGGGQPPPARRDAASGIDYDNDYTGSGRRTTAEQPPGGGNSSSVQPPGRKQPQPQPLQGSDDEDDGVVAYPAAGSAADAAEDEDDGVVAYPQAGGPADRFDEAAEFAKEQGAQPADTRRRQQDASQAAGSGSGGAPQHQQQPSPQGSGGGGGGQWAPPPSPGAGQGRGFQSRIDAVGKWKARRDGGGGSGGVSGLGGSANSRGADSSPAQDEAWTSRQAAYDSAPGPPKKPLAGPPPRPSAPPAAPAQQQQQQGPEEPTGNELDDLQKRFAALKQR
jgi:predicted DCC family thiol-disulfide oxidoreductase YuxK